MQINLLARIYEYNTVYSHKIDQFIVVNLLN